jgi:putative ABC transport system substrate-binding protein
LVPPQWLGRSWRTLNNLKKFLVSASLPSTRARVLVLSYLSDPIAPLQVAALDRVAPSLGVTLLVRDVRSGADLAAAFDAGMSEHVNGLM